MPLLPAVCDSEDEPIGIAGLAAPPPPSRRPLAAALSSPAATKRKKRLFGEDEEDDNKSDWDEACGPSEGVEGERWGVGSDCWSADEE